MNKVKMAKGVKLLLQGMGADLSDPNFKGTPRRVAKMYEELLTPDTLKTSMFPSRYDQLIVIRGHRVVALCPHHLMPVEMTVSVGYLPKKKVLGLSKIVRIMHQPLTRPIMQETFTDMVAQIMYEQCDPKGVGVYVTGTHGCMKYRGVNSDAETVNSRLRGLILENIGLHEEFMSIVRDHEVRK